MDTNLLTASELRTIRKDVRYARLLSSTKNIEIVRKAGFIDEPPIISCETSCIPLNDNPGIILLLTGCFAPTHAGHFNALEVARDALLKSQDLPVDAGFFGFCHDNYVLTKTHLFGLSTRLQKFHENLPTSCSWIYPYLWEAQQNGPMNFTSVIESLQSLYPKKTIVFVYGSDNINFRLAFLDDELQICIQRHTESKTPPILCDTKRVIYINGAYPNETSTRIRLS